MAQKEHPQQRDRMLFHNTGGRIEWERLIEQLIPMVVMGAIVVFANSKVTENQVGALQRDVASVRTEVANVISDLRATVDRAANDRSEIVRLQAQTAGYLQQQNSLNAAMDSRILRLEGALFPQFREVPRR